MVHLGHQLPLPSSVADRGSCARAGLCGNHAVFRSVAAAFLGIDHRLLPSVYILLLLQGM